MARPDRAIWSGTIAFRNEYFSDATGRIRRPSVPDQMARSSRAMTFSSGATRIQKPEGMTGGNGRDSRPGRDVAFYPSVTSASITSSSAVMTMPLVSGPR